jgi:23S rRNA pseudouridine955/2504/2580 synthase
MLDFRITDEDHCRPIGSWLRKRMPTATAGYLHQILKKGQLTVNGESVDEMHPLLLNDSISIKESGRIKALLRARVNAPQVDILFEDTRIVCVNKPNGLSMHTAAGAGSEIVTEMAASYLHARELAAHPHAAEPTFKLRPVNRLDRGTSGGVILAKSSTAAGMFGRLVMDGGLDKLYLALASGRLDGRGEIKAPVEEKESLTRYMSIFTGKDLTLVALWPETGRMHQIRQHLRHIGHPVVGDRRYGGPPAPTLKGFALHAFRTRFIHPESGYDTTIHAPLPTDFLAMLRTASKERYTDILTLLTSL